MYTPYALAMCNRDNVKVVGVHDTAIVVVMIPDFVRVRAACGC